MSVLSIMCIKDPVRCQFREWCKMLVEKGLMELDFDTRWFCYRGSEQKVNEDE